jgi:LemA protein
MPAPVVIAVLVALGLLAIWLIVSYNLLVRDRNLMQEAWSGIDVQLKRRHDLVPNIVELVEGYSSHERRLFEEVTRARAASMQAHGVKDIEAGENLLSQRLRTLFAVAENYPDLKADQTYLALQGQLVEVEDQIQMARRYYNGTVRNYDIRVESFPSNIAAGLFGFRRAEYFQIETATERSAPEVEIER